MSTSRSEELLLAPLEAEPNGDEVADVISEAGLLILQSMNGFSAIVLNLETKLGVDEAEKEV